MVRVGHPLGPVSAYLAGGLSLARADVDIDVAGVVDDSDDSVHFGWKIAPGLDFHFADNFVGFAQFEYADYGDKSYELVGVDFDLEMESMGGRVGLMYRF